MGEWRCVDNAEAKLNIAPSFLSSSPHAPASYSLYKGPQYPTDGRLGASKCQFWHCEEEKNLALWMIKPRLSSLQPIATLTERAPVPRVTQNVFTNENDNLY
jgi:hypothetical protein